MKILLEFRNPTPAHCDVAVFINGACTGTLRLGQEDITNFHSIVSHGCLDGLDTFLSRGNPNPPESDETPIIT
jgi:hypothetical protein